MINFGSAIAAPLTRIFNNTVNFRVRIAINDEAIWFGHLGDSRVATLHQNGGALTRKLHGS